MGNRKGKIRTGAYIGRKKGMHNYMGSLFHFSGASSWEFVWFVGFPRPQS